jgi:hypothetical protein
MVSCLDEKKYLFILSPPFCGSTLLYKIISTSPNVSTLIGHNNWVGEGQWLLINDIEDFNESNRWNPNYKLSFNKVKKCYDKYWNLNKDILCDKSPSNICRAKDIENYFSKFGEVYFIILMRNPYSCKSLQPYKWVEFAKYQKYNLENLSNKIIIYYEDLILKTEETKLKLLNFLPLLKSINMKIGYVPNLAQNLPSEQKIFGLKNRDKPLLKKYLRIIGKNRKNKILINYIDLLKYFGYNFIF